MTHEDIDKPWALLPEHVKQWARDNGYVIRENESRTGGTVYTEWQTKYLEYLQTLPKSAVDENAIVLLPNRTRNRPYK